MRSGNETTPQDLRRGASGVWGSTRGGHTGRRSNSPPTAHTRGKSRLPLPRQPSRCFHSGGSPLSSGVAAQRRSGSIPTSPEGDGRASPCPYPRTRNRAWTCHRTRKSAAPTPVPNSGGRYPLSPYSLDWSTPFLITPSKNSESSARAERRSWRSRETRQPPRWQRSGR